MILVYMLFYSINQLENNNLIEINYCNINDFNIKTEDINYNLVRVENKKNAPGSYYGIANIIIKNNNYYMVTEEGLYDINNKIIINNDIKIVNKLKHLSNNVFYIENKDMYLNFNRDTSVYDKFFFQYSKLSKNINIFFNKKKYIISVLLIKSINNKYIYPLSYDIKEITSNLYECSLTNKKKCYIIEYDKKLDEWVQSDITYDLYEKYDYQIKFNEFIYKLFRFDLLDSFENLCEIIPDCISLNCILKTLKETNEKFLVECIKKFGCNIASKNSHLLFKSTDLKNWDMFSYMSDCYKNIFDENPSPSIDILHTIPSNDTLPNILYNPCTDIYVHYNRANIHFHCRYIGVSFSKNLKDWTNYETIRLHPPFQYRRDHDNIYVPSIFIYKSYYLGIWTFFDEKINIITYQYYISKNGIDFFKIHNFHKENIKHEIHIDDICQIILPNSLNEKDNKITFYSWIMNLHRRKGNLNKWSIRKDGFTSIKSIEENISSYLTKLVIIKNNKLIINFKTEEDGYIKVQLLDKSNNLIKGYDFDSCKLITGDECNYVIKWNNNEFIDEKQVKIEVKLYKAEIFSFNCEEIYFFENNKKFDKIIYYYLENNNFRDNEHNDTWKIKDLKLPNDIYATELLGKPIYENKMTLVKQKIKLSNNEIITITLEDNTDKKFKKYDHIFKNKYTIKGEPCSLFDIRLINIDGINIINKDEIYVLYDENLSIEYNKNDSNIIITYSSNFDKRIGSSGFYFEISELYFQKNKFRVEFDARLINLDSEKKIKIYTGSKYIILDGNLTKNWNSFSLIEEFDFKSPSKYRINLVNPDNNLKYEIKNFAIYIEQIL